MKTKHSVFLLCSILAIGMADISHALTTSVIPVVPEVEWIRQWGTSASDVSRGVSFDGLGIVYAAGYTNGSLASDNAGSFDAFVRKFDETGTHHWTTQFGSSRDDRVYGVSADGLGNVYVSGSTEGKLGEVENGNLDAFLGKFDSSGAHVWTNQLGTISRDESFAVSADGLGNVYITGYTQGELGGPRIGGRDAFVSRYDGDGSLLWTKQFGTTGYDESWGVSADGLGNVYIAGVTDGSVDGTIPGGYDAFVSKFDSNGTLLWAEQIGTRNSETSYAVSADQLGNVFITGHTQGSLGGAASGRTDGFVSKYDASGTLQWTQQMGTRQDELGRGISADGSGNVYVSGFTKGDLEGTSDRNNTDAFVRKYDTAGVLLWTEQLGISTDASDLTFGVSADGLNNDYVTGITNGDLVGANAGGTDGFVARIIESAIPEPSSSTIACVALVGLMFRRR